MGKPFKTELNCLANTYQWGLNQNIEILKSFVNASINSSLVSIGSGGSFTAAHMAALLHQQVGMLAKCITPFGIYSLGDSIYNSSIMVISAEGKNSDVLSAYEFAAKFEPKSLMAFCINAGSPLAALSEKYRNSYLLDFLKPPYGKDGFLATNSLLSFLIFLVRAYIDYFPCNYSFPQAIPSFEEMVDFFCSDIETIVEKNTWIVLYGGWGLPAAIDLESKFTESALGNIQVADYRNFGHGRHHWIAKKGEETGIIALATPDEIRIAERTLNAIPENIPRVIVKTDLSGPIGSIDLYLKILYITYLTGLNRSIDPGMPGVPEFGRKIYHLGLTKNDTKLPSNLRNSMETALTRKLGPSLVKSLSSKELLSWEKIYKKYIQKLEGVEYGAIVFDYDGTLCGSNQRFSGMSAAIQKELEILLSEGIAIGIATGRGRSVSEDLKRVILDKYWDQIIIGYYNGSDIGFLFDEKHPDKEAPVNESIQLVIKGLENFTLFEKIAKYECRPSQITIIPCSTLYREQIISILQNIIINKNVHDVSILESSHSIDIVACGVSKLNLVYYIKDYLSQKQMPTSVLCIGDKGKWPGNDYALLSTPYSLSVDSVSMDPDSCWNLCKTGSKGIQGSLDYLGKINASNGKFTLTLTKEGKE